MPSRILSSFKQIFLKALFFSFCILFWLVTFVCPIVEIHTVGGKKKKDRCVIFKILRNTLILSLLSILMTWFSFVFKWFICFNHSNWLSKRAPMYFTVLVGILPQKVFLTDWSQHNCKQLHQKKRYVQEKDQI